MSQDGEDRSDAHELPAYVFSAPHDRMDGEWRNVTPTLPIRDEKTHAQDGFVRARLGLPRHDAFPPSSAALPHGGELNMD